MEQTSPPPFSYLAYVKLPNQCLLKHQFIQSFFSLRTYPKWLPAVWWTISQLTLNSLWNVTHLTACPLNHITLAVPAKCTLYLNLRRVPSPLRSLTPVLRLGLCLPGIPDPSPTLGNPSGPPLNTVSITAAVTATPLHDDMSQLHQTLKRYTQPCFNYTVL